MVGHTGFLKSWRHRRRGLLAVVGTVLALTGIAIALAPPQSSQAAQGTPWPTGMPAAGVIATNTGKCSVTVVSQWLAITAKHCGIDSPKLKLNVSDAANAGEYRIKSITPNPTKDVEAIFLRKRIGLPVLPLRASVAPDLFSAWGYGPDRSSKEANHLTKAEFNLTGSTLSAACPANVNVVRGSLCWPTTASNSVCIADEGGPVTQNGAIIGMSSGFGDTDPKLLPDGSIDCSAVTFGQALTIKDMQPWLDQMIKAADPVN